MLTKSDKTLIFVITGLSLGCYFLFNLHKDVNNILIVEADGREMKEINLPQNLILDGLGKDGSIKIEIKGNNVRVLDSSCPNKICIKSGWINKSGESIICLPNRTVIKISGEEEGLDGVAR